MRARVGDRPPKKNNRLFWGGGGLWLRFSHYNFAPVAGGGERFGVRPSLKNQEKNFFGLYGGRFCYFFLYVGGIFCLYGGGLFVLAPLTKSSAIYFT